MSHVYIVMKNITIYQFLYGIYKLLINFSEEKKFIKYHNLSIIHFNYT